jgi:hypothetical protein
MTVTQELDKNSEEVNIEDAEETKNTDTQNTDSNAILEFESNFDEESTDNITADITTDTVTSAPQDVPSIIRTAEHGCWEVYNGTWGSYLRRTFDPDANAEVTEEHLKHFELKEGIHKIPAELWAKWVRLCFHFVDKVTSSVEVSVRILRSESDPSVYRILVPKQKVSGASVRVDSFDESIDIDTGEEIATYPPDGWIPVGSSHSHNTMSAFFSGTDDKYELGDPGIHLVIGSIKIKEMKYTIAASVVGSGRRFLVSYDDLIDATPIPNADFHPKVLEYVDYTSPVVTYVTKGGVYNNRYTKPNTTSYGSTKWSKKETPSDGFTYDGIDYSQYWGYDRDGDYVDPFYWSENYHSNPRTTNNAYGSGRTEVWNIKDILEDFVKDNAIDVEALNDLKNEMYDFLGDLEVYLMKPTLTN